MGKVYDALQRAEEQRLRRSGEAGVFGEVQPGSSAMPSRRAARSWWRGLLKRSERREDEDAATLNKRRIAMLQPQSFVTEQFRSLRARLEARGAQQPLRTIAVTSAVAGEGKTTAAVNLALVMAMSVGRKVVLVDCDLRRPRVHQSLGLHVEGGLAEILSGEMDVEQALSTVDGSTLRVVSVRALPPNPSELLASAAMRELIAKLGTQWDHVVLDLPPVLGLPDAKEVTELCDGILMVVRAHSTPQEDVGAALDVLDRSRVVGVVLNEADVSASSYGYAG